MAVKSVRCFLKDFKDLFIANPIYTCKHAETCAPDPASLDTSTIPYTVSDRENIHQPLQSYPTRLGQTFVLEFTQYSNKGVKFKHSMNIICTTEC